MSDPTRVTACTIVARNYLPAARVLAAGYLEHHPDHRFVIGVIDLPRDADATETTGTGARLRVRGPGAFGIDEAEYGRMATAYSVTELATAVKPFLLRELRRDADVAIYLDPDIAVFAPMPELAPLATEHGIVLTPHFLAPLPRDGKEPDEAVIMGTGVFNLGFIAVGAGSEPFLDFWAVRLRHDAIDAREQQLFTDQRWVDQVPALFGNTVLRDPGFNVAYWNLHERGVTRDDGGAWSVDGAPLRFFHFSGYRPEKPWLLSYHCVRDPRVLLSERPELRELCDGYGAALRAAGYGETLDSIPYGYARFGDGTPITTLMRRLYRAEWIDAERRGAPLPPPAFGPDGDADLRAWLAEPGTPAEAAASLTRLAMAVWRSRVDLQAVFPRPTGDSAEHFRAWCRASGVAEQQLPGWALPAEPPAPRMPDPGLGVNVLGYLTAALGIGELGRLVHEAVRDAGIPSVSVVEERAVSNRTDVPHDGEVGRPRHPISLLVVNADQTAVMHEHCPEIGHQRHRIGVWSWELETLPAEHHAAFALVDEIWTISDFAAKAIAADSPVPVKVLPIPVRDPGPRLVRERVPGTPVTFLFAFDFNSIAERKNPDGLVEAFQTAFPDRDDVRLVIKAINGSKHVHKAERLRVRVAGDPRVELVERYLSVEELDRLYADADAYVSLHRSEGFGLTVLEAMARGLPVVSTDYSGTAEFVDARTGWPIPHTLVPVGPGCEPYPAEDLWAEPDLAAAAAALREIAADPAAAAERGRAAREHVLATRSQEAAARWVRAELVAAHRTWSTRSGGPQASADSAEEPLTPLREAREALKWRPDVAAASKSPLAPALRKVVLRAIDHYDVHQRSVLDTLVQGVERTVGRVLRRVERAEAVAAERTLAEGDRVHQELLRRDERLDLIEAEVRTLRKDTDALHEAARLRHAPLPAGTEVVVCDAGALVMAADKVTYPWIRHHRSWEVAEAELMAELVTARPGTVLDVGAHVGYHALRLLARCPDLPRVVAVEADPETADLLRRNVEANLPPSVATRVHVLPAAAWDTTGEVELVHADPTNSGDNRVGTPTGHGTPVPALRLDEHPTVLAEPVTLVKVDLQGRDHRALAGLSVVLTRDQPHIVCEFCPDAITELGDDPLDVLTAYRDWGYDLSIVDIQTPHPPTDDKDLVAHARHAESGFVTLWLHPRNA